MSVNSLPKTVTRKRRGCDLNPDPSAPEYSTLTTRLPSHLAYQSSNHSTGTRILQKSLARWTNCLSKSAWNYTRYRRRAVRLQKYRVICWSLSWKLLYKTIRLLQEASEQFQSEQKERLSFKQSQLVGLLHTFNGLFSRTAWVSWYQKGKTSLDLNEARDDGVLGMAVASAGHLQTICTSPQTDNHTNTSSVNFFMLSGSPTNSVKSLKANSPK